MGQRKLGTLALAGVVALTACADEPTAPPTSDRTPSTSVAPAASVASSEAPRTTDRHLVVFREKRVPGGFAASVARLGGDLDRTFDEFGAAIVSGLDGGAAAELEKIRQVAIVEPEIVLAVPNPMIASRAAPADALPSSPSDPSAAFFFARQWNMHAIDADDAWAAGHLGSSDVTVAILDTGVDYLYPDLQGRVDLSRSVSMLTTYLVNVADPGDPPDFVAYTENDTVAKYFPARHPVTDLHVHGTHVSATVASNGLVAAGVTSRTTLIGVKVCGYLIGCPGGAVVGGIEHAVENGADVINLSLGGLFQAKAAPGLVATINRVFDYANRNGVTVVVAAGNDAADLDRGLVPVEDEDGNVVDGHFPSLYGQFCDTPHNVCVAATGPTSAASVDGPWTDVDAPAPYTNFGRSAIEVAAPGGSTGGVVWAACSSSSLILPVCQTGTFILGMAGTSMASPHAAGLAALMVARHGRNPGRVRSALRGAADDLGQPGTDPFYGKGRINVARAVGVN